MLPEVAEAPVSAKNNGLLKDVGDLGALRRGPDRLREFLPHSSSGELSHASPALNLEDGMPPPFTVQMTPLTP
jgi:hypothetical protein